MRPRRLDAADQVIIAAQMTPVIRHCVVLAVLNVPVYVLIGRMIFGGWAGFVEAVGYWFTPDWLSMVRGLSLEDTWATLKLLLFAGLCAAVVAEEYTLLYARKPVTALSLGTGVGYLSSEPLAADLVPHADG